MAGGLAVCITGLLCAGTVFGGPPGAEGDLYVANYGANMIVQVDSATGGIVGDFVTSGLSGPFEARFGPNGNLFVVNISSGLVTEHDGNTGDLIGNYVSGLSGPTGLRFEANGNLLIFESGTSSIKEFDTNGNLLGIFASGVFGDDAPMDFGPDGDLFFSNYDNDVVQRFGPDGTYQGIFASGGSLDGPQSHVFGPNGNFFVSSFFGNTIVEFDGTTGVLVGDFVDTDLAFPAGLAFGPDGNVWVASYLGGNISEFDGTTGAFIQQVGGFLNPLSVTVKPSGTTGVGDTPAVAIAQVAMVAMHPNPFNPQTTVAFTVPHAGQVTLAVFDLQGRHVRTLVSGHLAAGDHTAIWNGCLDDGQACGSGLYFARMLAADVAVTAKLMLVK